MLLSRIGSFVSSSDRLSVGISIGDSFRSHWSLLKIAVDEKNLLAFLANPYIIGFSVLFLILAILRRSYKPFMIPLSMWGYGVTYHYSLGRSDVDITDYMNVSADTMWPVFLFLAGFVIVTGLIIYFWIQDG